MAGGGNVHVIHFVLLLQLTFFSVTHSLTFGRKASASQLEGINLRPDYPRTLYQNNGGKLGMWDGRGSDLAGIKVTVGGNSVFLPAHFDTDLVAYVVEGSAKWGLVYPSGTWVELVPLEEGDAFLIPKEAVAWFYNDDVSKGSPDFTFVAFGETSNSLKRGIITVLPIIGSGSMYLGFDEQTLGDAWAIEKGMAKRLIHQQNVNYFLKLEMKIYLNNPEAYSIKGDYVFKTFTREPDVYIPGGGKQWTIVASEEEKYKMLGQFNLGVELIYQRENSLYGPAFVTNANLLIYIIKGQGHVWLVEPFNNVQILDIHFVEGQVLSIPRGYGFLIVAREADDLQHFIVSDNAQPTMTFFAGKKSPYLGIPWEILRVGFDVDDTLIDKVLHSRTWEYTILPPYTGEKEYSILKSQNVSKA